MAALREAYPFWDYLDLKGEVRYFFLKYNETVLLENGSAVYKYSK